MSYSEQELEDAIESAFESDTEDEQSASLGELEGELEGENLFEFEGEDFQEMEGEEFFRKLSRKFKTYAPLLKKVAKIAVPIISTAVGGPAGGVLAGLATSALREQEGEAEYERDGRLERSEHDLEGEFETEGEPETDATAEVMASAAAELEAEQEAEAMIGAATVIALTTREREVLRSLVPHLVRGVAVLTRILRRRRPTRIIIRSIPTIMKRTTTVLTRRAGYGRPVSRRIAGRVMAQQAYRILSRPNLCAMAVTRNLRNSHRLARPASVAMNG